MTFPDTVTQAVTFTQPAAEAVREIIKQKNLEGYALRLYISGGGCSGYQYGLALDNRIRPEDIAFETTGIKLIIDEVSIKYLQGATVDYVDEGETASGFKILNPNNLSSCGCGQSESASDESSCGCSGCG